MRMGIGIGIGIEVGSSRSSNRTSASGAENADGDHVALHYAVAGSRRVASPQTKQNAHISHLTIQLPTFDHATLTRVPFARAHTHACLRTPSIHPSIHPQTTQLLLPPHLNSCKPSAARPCPCPSSRIPTTTCRSDGQALELEV